MPHPWSLCARSFRCPGSTPPRRSRPSPSRTQGCRELNQPGQLALGFLWLGIKCCERCSQCRSADRNHGARVYLTISQAGFGPSFCRGITELQDEVKYQTFEVATKAQDASLAAIHAKEEADSLSVSSRRTLGVITGRSAKGASPSMFTRWLPRLSWDHWKNDPAIQVMVILRLHLEFRRLSL